jgi:hypothetical protein
MTAMPLWMWPILVVTDLFGTWAPRRYAIPGKTRVRFSFSCSAEKRANEGYTTVDTDEGVVVGYQYDYVGPSNNTLHCPLGTYTRHEKFPDGLIVQSDSGGEPRCVPLENAELISGYGRTVPGFGYAKYREPFRIGPLPVPLHFYPEDIVYLAEDKRKIQREVGRVFFSPAGTPEYEVLMTNDEIRLENQRLEEEARIHNENREPGDDWERGYVVCEGGTHVWARESELYLVSRGNHFHLHEGTPEALTFPSLEDEVRFFAHEAGEWEEGYRTREQALALMQKGEYDLAVDMFENEFCMIRILPHFARARDRARRAGIALMIAA